MPLRQKAGTAGPEIVYNDMRDAPSIPLVTGLVERGAEVVAFDPVGHEQARPLLPAITYAPSPEAVADDADVVTSVAAAASAALGEEMDRDTIDGLKTAISEQIESESLPAFLSGMLYDDGVIDPRDTRAILGLSLSAIHSGDVSGTDRFGVFRM